MDRIKQAELTPEALLYCASQVIPALAENVSSVNQV